jgi:nucleotide-binding universal stress UspA family protein
MSYAVVMAFVEANSKPDQRVRLAASLADKFNATLIGLSALAVHPPFLVEGVAIQQASPADIVEIMSTLTAKGDWFRSVAGLDHQRLEWRPVLDYPVDALARTARSADLVVTGQTKGPGDALASLDPGEVLLKIGRPVLIVPDGVSSLRAEHVVIGWKDTREARRAVLDALPFLHEASRVTVVEICDGGEENTAQEHLDDVVRYLARHRINATPRVLLRDHGSSGAAGLIKIAQQEGADLIVAGAYGHSRLGEWIFGGVTQDLLAASSICCLMSH